MGNGQAQVALGEPRGEGRRSFRCYELEGLMVFVHPQAVMTGSKVKIKVFGLGIFKWPQVSGVGDLVGCGAGSRQPPRA